MPVPERLDEERIRALRDYGFDLRNALVFGDGTTIPAWTTVAPLDPQTGEPTLGFVSCSLAVIGGPPPLRGRVFAGVPCRTLARAIGQA